MHTSACLAARHASSFWMDTDFFGWYRLPKMAKRSFREVIKNIAYLAVYSQSFCIFALAKIMIFSETHQNESIKNDESKCKYQ